MFGTKYCRCKRAQIALRDAARSLAFRSLGDRRVEAETRRYEQHRSQVVGSSSLTRKDEIARSRCRTISSSAKAGCERRRPRVSSPGERILHDDGVDVGEIAA